MPIDELQHSVTLLGVFFLGGFVGFLVTLAIDFSTTVNLKVLSALIGAALGGAPILFMSGLSFEKWMYPIGLVTGMLWVRVFRAAAEKRRGRKSKPFYLWIDILAIIAFTCVVVLCATFASGGIWASIRNVLTVGGG